MKYLIILLFGITVQAQEFDFGCNCYDTSVIEEWHSSATWINVRGGGWWQETFTHPLLPGISVFSRSDSGTSIVNSNIDFETTTGNDRYERNGLKEAIDFLIANPCVL